MVATTGLPYSGKSTFAKQLAALTDARVIELDELNAARGLDVAAGVAIEEWQDTFTVTDQLAREALASGKSVVIDWVNPGADDRRRWRDLARDCGAPFVLVAFDIDLAELERRHAAGGGRVVVDDALRNRARARYRLPDPDEGAVMFESSTSVHAWAATHLPGTTHLPSAQLPDPPRLLPTDFQAATVFLRTCTTDGHELEFYLDSGGGDWIYRSTADEIRAIIRSAADEHTWASAQLPPLRPETWIPPPQPDGVLLLNPDGPDPDPRHPPLGRSGMLGQRWFADRIWEIDYPRKRMLLHSTIPPTSSTRVPLGFPERNGTRLCHFGRVQVVIDGETLDMLLDTGAHTRLGDGADQIGAPGSVTATSFIITSTLQRWSARHPDWQVAQRAEAGSGATMIRVPSVRIGDVDTGPVWFTERADANFTEYMSQWMDRPVVGAVGGNAFTAFRLVIDYPTAQLHIDPSHDS